MLKGTLQILCGKEITFPYPVGESIAGKYQVLTLTYGYIFEDGSYAIKPTFDDAEPFIEGIARVGIIERFEPRSLD